MQAEEIKALLLELAQEDCTFQRHQEVSQLFYQAAKRRPAPDVTNDDASQLLSMILNRLLRVVGRQYLPGLLPVFIMICGERHELDTLAEIDWTLMS